MSLQRDGAADGYPTRRQLRQAASAAASASTPAAGVPVTGASPAAAAEDPVSESEAQPEAGPAAEAGSAPLTRRQIREQERRARERAEADRETPEQQAAQSDTEQEAAPSAPEQQEAALSAPTPLEPAAVEETDAQDDAEAEPTATSPELPEEAAARVATDAEPAAMAEPAPRDVPRARTSRGSDSTKSPARRWLPRLAVLGALAALTTVVPLTGAALPSTSSDPSTGAPLAEASALDVFSAGGTQVSTDASAALAADPLASVRSMVASSRSDERGSTCAAGAMEANGVLASEVEVITTPEVMMPLSEGSYHYTSRYGVRAHPIFGSYGEHTGLDMAAAAGTPIHAIADGTVVHAGNGMDGRSSMLVIIEHEVDGQPIWTWYVHMYPNGVYVSEGQQVSAGEAIGAVGSYGNSTGPHLHFEVHLDEAQTTIDPEAWLASNAAPLNSETLRCAEG